MFPFSKFRSLLVLLPSYSFLWNSPSIKNLHIYFQIFFIMQFFFEGSLLTYANKSLERGVCWVNSSLGFFILCIPLYLFMLNHFSLNFHEWYFSSQRRTLYVWNHVSFFLSHEHFFGLVYSSWVIIFFLNKFLNIAQLFLAWSVVGMINDANL